MVAYFFTIPELSDPLVSTIGQKQGSKEASILCKRQSPIRLPPHSHVWYDTPEPVRSHLRIINEGDAWIVSDNKQTQGVRTVWWEDGASGAAVCLLDQSLLPQEVVYLRLKHEQEVADAIKTLKVRGAPAIGVAAAFGLALSLHRLIQEQDGALSLSAAQQHVHAVGELFSKTRPTAVNLFWAIERMLLCADIAIDNHATLQDLAHLLQGEAQSIANEDFDACMAMGNYGAELIADGDMLLTHCNAGALATAGWGTALAPMYVAHKAGKRIHVFVDETRPVLQGARLTAWELQQEGIPLTLITDSMVGHFMRLGGIKAVFVGADRVVANGDVANKIGTYSVAVLARAHQIPFYVAAPSSTIDLDISSGDSIPIEQRNPEEVTSVRGTAIAPTGIQAANPAFDVTPHAYITAIITERGIVRPPYEEGLRRVCTDSRNHK
jgi:methylthioribose-1-phosphate isomerase